MWETQVLWAFQRVRKIRFTLRFRETITIEASGVPQSQLSSPAKAGDPVFQRQW
jgi:hypothetical protein